MTDIFFATFKFPPIPIPPGTTKAPVVELYDSVVAEIAKLSLINFPRQLKSPLHCIDPVAPIVSKFVFILLFEKLPVTIVFAIVTFPLKKALLPK